MSWDRLPRNTCPIIDSVISQIRSHVECSGQVKSMVSEMEDIRSANAALREAAEEAREKADSLDEQILEAQQEAGALRLELKDAYAALHEAQEALEKQAAASPE